MQFIKCLVQGPAQVGKTHVKALIMKKKLEEGKSPSTNCVEQAVRAVCTEKFAEDAESWKEVNAEELMKMLTKEIKHQHESPSSPPRKKQKLTEPSSSVQSHKMPGSTTADGDVKSFVEEFQGLISNCKGVKMHQKWMYFVDSGGQPQFHNVFQAFIQNTSVLLLVFDLTKKLSESNKHCIQDKEGHIFQNFEGNTAQRVEDVLKSIASTIASQPKEEEEEEEEAVAKMEDRAVAKKDKRAIFLVGTFKDSYDDLCKKSEVLETIQEKEKKLGGLFGKDEIKKIGSNLIFTVNGLQAERGEFNDEMVCAIREKIHDHLEETKPHPIPIRWFALELALEKKATSLNRKVLSYEECKAVANTLHISDLQVALEFLQDCSLLLFYPGPDLDLVFTDPQALLKFFSDIVIEFIHLSDKFSGSATEVDNFQKAILSFGASKKLFDKSCSPVLKVVLTCDKALKIFQKLLIAAKIDEDNFFIPALLPVQDIHEARPQGESLVPLVFLFSDNCTPSGLFCAVVVKLLSSNWEVHHTEAKAYSNAVTLLRKKCKPKLAITFIDSFKSFEVHCSKEDKLPEVKNEIEEVIKSVIRSRKYKCGPPQIAFISPCSECQFAILEESGDICCDCDNSYPPEETQKERKWLQGVSLFFVFFNVLITFILATDLGAGAGSSVAAAHGATAVPSTLTTSQGKYRTHAKINDTLVLQLTRTCCAPQFHSTCTVYTIYISDLTASMLLLFALPCSSCTQR